jgi:glutaminyl-peptide cyclotransferase
LQKQHVLTGLNDEELKRLAKFTDAQSIRALLKPILVERQVGTKQHDAVAYVIQQIICFTDLSDFVISIQYLKTKSEEFGFQTEWDSFNAWTPLGQKPFHNLIATFDPLVHRRLVLACHYDSKILTG